jgi:hypothetical protein
LVQYNDNGTDEILLIQKDTINNALGSFKNKPVYITHESDKIVGNVVDIYYDMDTAGYIMGFISDNKDVENLLSNKNWGVSCTYEILQSGNGGKYHEIEYNKEVYALAFKNLCIVENPRYQEAREIINGVENGGVGSGIKGHRTANKYEHYIKKAKTFWKEAHGKIPTTTKEKFVKFRKIKGEEAEKLKGETGLDLQGFKHAVGNKGFRHIYQKHGEDNEKDKKQRGVKEGDVLLIPKITEKYDKIKLEKGKNTLDGIKYTRGKRNYVEVIKEGRKTLEGKTMYIKK